MGTYPFIVGTNPIVSDEPTVIRCSEIHGLVPSIENGKRFTAVWLADGVLRVTESVNTMRARYKEATGQDMTAPTDATKSFLAAAGAMGHSDTKRLK